MTEYGLGPNVRSPNFNFSAPFGLEIAATLLIHPLLVGVAGISRPKGARLQGETPVANCDQIPSSRIEVATSRVAIEWLPRPNKNTPTEFYMKKKPHKAQNIAA